MVKLCISDATLGHGIRRVWAFLRKKAASELRGRELHAQLEKCLIDYAMGRLGIRPRDDRLELYSRLNGKERMQFTIAVRVPEADEVEECMFVDIPAASVAKDVTLGLHVSQIYTSDKGNKQNKKLRSA